MSNVYNEELMVVEVLASLGKSGYMGDGDGGGGWRCKGRRSSYCKHVRVSFEDVDRDEEGVGVGVGDSSVHVQKSLPLPFDLNMDQAVLNEEEDDYQPNVDVKAEEEYEPAEGSSNVFRNRLPNVGRSRQVLSEAEKEARKLRRILANREPARQTIRRRQALYEELKRKATELASENEDLKRRKNTAVQEFQSLQSTSQNLKNKVGLELGYNPEAQLANSHKWQHLWANKFLPNNLTLPGYVQPSHVEIPQPPSHSGSLNLDPPVSGITTPSQFNANPLNEQENISRGTTQHIPWCILPFQWFLSLPDTVKNAPQLGSLKLSGKDKETLLHATHVCSPSSVIPRLHECSTSSDVRTPFQADISTSLVTSACFESSMKKSDAAEAGMEARRRRREVIKLKSLHYDSVSRLKYA